MAAGGRGFVVREVGLDDLTTTFASSVVTIEQAMWSETDPHEPPMPDEEAMSYVTVVPAGHRRDCWLGLTEDGAAVGMIALKLPLTDNLEIAHVRLGVLPGWRRAGIGRALLEAAAGRAISEGRRALLSTTISTAPAGAAFAQAVGATAGLVGRASELDLIGLDRSLVRSWAAAGEALGDTYELWWVDGAYPSESYAAVADIASVMSTAPVDDLELEPLAWTAERVAEDEAQLALDPAERHSLFVRHRPSGRLVAMTRVYSYDTWPGVFQQADTCVHPDHRGHGLGKWVKAAMIERLWRDWPDARKVRTANAFSNGPMLAINNALGFRITKEIVEWQVPTEALFARASR